MSEEVKEYMFMLRTFLSNRRKSFNIFPHLKGQMSTQLKIKRINRTEMVETSSVAGDNVTTLESDADETVNAVPAIPETSKHNSDVSITTSTREKATSSGSNKSKKRSQQDDLLASFMEMQEKSEERFLEFERKRMEIELKAEEKRQDREDEQERKQQAFLLELARIFSSNK